MKLELVKIRDLDEKMLCRLDEFICSANTNGEFINTYQYLSYHPENRFKDDSAAVVDLGSSGVRGVMMAAQDGENEKRVVSHPGTTFAGPVLESKIGIKDAAAVLDLLLGYYEEQYEEVEIRLRPSVYDAQPQGLVPYCLLMRGYRADMMGLANVINLRAAGDDLFRLYDSKRRNQVRKVIKEGQFTFGKAEEINPQIWENMNLNLDRKHHSFATHTYEEIARLSGLFPEKIVPFEVRKGDEYGAFSLIYKYKNIFHTQYLDLNYAISSEYPHLYLIHHLLLQAREEGYAYFSFGASTQERGQNLNEGLYHYKAGYGGGSVILPVYIRGKE